MKFVRLLLILLILILVIFGIRHYFLKPKVVEIETTHQPTIGSPAAATHVVVFEEIKCGDCKEFNDIVFPKIKQEFIDTHQIRYTVIPVSFLSDSMGASIALVCVYNQDPGYPNADLFFKLLDFLYNHPWTSDENLIEISQSASPSIDLGKLKNCIAQESFRKQVESNTAYAKKLQRGTLVVPSVYIDGKRIDPPTYEKIAEVIRSKS